MNASDDFDRLLGEWLEDGPTQAPHEAIERATAHARSHPRRPDPFAFLRRSAMTSRTTPVVLRPAWILLLLSLLLAAVVAAVGIGSRNDAPVVVVPSPTAAASPTGATPPTTSPSPTTIATASRAPTATAASTIVLRRAPDNLGCDSIASTYSSATIRIDPSAAEQVWAEIDTLVPDPPDPQVAVGDRLLVYWSPSFSGGDASDPTVRDSSGAVVARDGTRTGELQPPYYLCAGNGDIYVLDTPLGG